MTGKKFYLASSFKLIHRVQKITDLLEAYGHTITEKWWDREYETGHTTELKKRYDKLRPGVFYQLKETEKSYMLDFQGIKDCDIFIFVADDKARRYNGACVELGIALAYGKPCYLLGSLENSVMFYQLKRLDCIDTLIYKLVFQGDQ